MLLVGGADLLVQGVQRLRHRPAPQPGRFALAVAVVLLLFGVARSAPLVLKEADCPARVRHQRMELRRCTSSSLMDIPESTRSEKLGIDNEPFIDALAARGFDHYPEAGSAHGYTNLTLADMFAGEVVGPSDDDPIMNTAEWNQEQRFNLRWPAPYYVLDPPLVTWLPSAGHTGTEGASPTGRRPSLGARSSVPCCAICSPASLRTACEPTKTQRSRNWRRRTKAPSSRTSFSPHPPFLYVEDLPQCWPHSVRTVRQSDREDWHHYRGLERSACAASSIGLNSDLLATIDRITERHPDAAIVLFSDHGGRYSFLERGTSGTRRFWPLGRRAIPGSLIEEAEPSAVLRLITRHVSLSRPSRPNVLPG